MDLTTIFIFYLPLFVVTFLFSTFIEKQKKKERISKNLRRLLNVIHFIIVVVLILQLYYWFIVPLS